MDDKILYVLGYCALMVIAAIAMSKSRSVHDFLIAGRKNPGFVMAAGLTIGSIDAMWFVFFAGLAYTIGWAFIWIILGVIACFIVLQWKVPHIKAVSTQHDMHTLTDWLYHHIGAGTGKAAGFVVILNYFAWTVAVIASASFVFAGIFHVSYPVAVAGMAAITLPLLLKGGYASLTRFDVLQFLLVAVGLALVYALGFTDAAHIEWPAADTVGRLGWFGGASLFVSLFSSAFAGTDIWQRMYAANGAREARRGFSITYVFFSISLLVTAMLGFIARGSGYTGPEDGVFSHVVLVLLNPVGQALFLIILLAAVTSTLTVATFATSMTLAKEFFRRDNGDAALQRRARRIMTATIIGASAIALIVPSIMTLALATLTATNCIAGLLFITLFTRLRLHDVSGIAAVLTSFAAFLYMLYANLLTPEYAGLTLAINVVVALLVEGALRLRRVNQAA